MTQQRVQEESSSSAHVNAGSGRKGSEREGESSKHSARVSMSLDMNKA
jgi:hypothetical protein